MKARQQSILKDLVLIGGGHSHVAVIKSFGMNPIPGVRLTVITRDVHTPYSGMLPGFVAGHYDFDDAHIDLRPLAQFAGARLYHDEAAGIDAQAKTVICKGRPPVAYDLLSINIGSTPKIDDVAGASEFGVAVKPINRFVNRWHELVARSVAQPGPRSIGVVGAGAGGVELLLAIQHRLENLWRELERDVRELSFHLISNTDRILPGFPPGVGRRFERILKQRRVIVHRGAGAVRSDDGGLMLSNGSRLELDETLFVTAARAASWLAESGLEVDADGFIKVESTLQALNHPDIFAAGDVAAMIDHPRPKAGVFAVRQGPPLTENLRRALLNKALKTYKPQRTFLSLISTGDKCAVATKGSLSLAGKALWTWKDWIDRRFVKKYADLPEMTEEAPLGVDPALADSATLQALSDAHLRCGGCGAKVGADVLDRALSDITPLIRDDILIGLHEADDAAVVEVPPGAVMVHSVDYFRAFIDDPYLFGKIAANHSLSDIFAMAAKPQSALAIATLPYGVEAKVEETLRQMMAGATEVLSDAGAALIGGHTSEGAELALGFSVNGLADKALLLRKGGMRPGDALILTKALGTGTLFAADMRRKAKGRWIDGALHSMLLSNRLAADCLFEHGATACTDITGFGLLGHLVEMTRRSGVEVEINLAAAPLLEGALETIHGGIVSTLQRANLSLRGAVCNNAEAAASEVYPLMFDPQTSGGLLASLPADRAQACVRKMRELGYGAATVIGAVGEKCQRSDSVFLRP